MIENPTKQNALIRLLTPLLVILVTVVILAPMSNFVITIMGYFFANQSNTPFTSGRLQTYVIGCIFFSPLLLIIHFTTRKFPWVSLALSTLAYGGLVFTIMWMQAKGQFSITIVMLTLFGAIVGVVCSLIINSLTARLASLTSRLERQTV